MVRGSAAFRSAGRRQSLVIGDATGDAYPTFSPAGPDRSSHRERLVSPGDRAPIFHPVFANIHGFRLSVLLISNYAKHSSLEQITFNLRSTVDLNCG